MSDPGVLDEHVDRPQLALDALGRALDLGGVGHVAGIRAARIDVQHRDGVAP